MKRGLTIVSSRPLLATAIEQQLADLEVAVANGEMKRGVTLVGSGLLLATAMKQQLADLDVSVMNRDMKRRAILVIPGLLLSSTIEQELADLDLALLGCGVKRGAVALPVHTNIEVQPTETHISGSQHLMEPVIIDGATLLAQRVRSPCCRRRRQLDHAATLEGTHAFVVERTPADLQAHLPDIQRRQRGLQGRLEGCQRSAVGIQRHRHFRTPERCGDFHCCLVVRPLFRTRNAAQTQPNNRG